MGALRELGRRLAVLLKLGRVKNEIDEEMQFQIAAVPVEPDRSGKPGLGDSGFGADDVPCGISSLAPGG